MGTTVDSAEKNKIKQEQLPFPHSYRSILPYLKELPQKEKPLHNRHVPYYYLLFLLLQDVEILSTQRSLRSSETDFPGGNAWELEMRSNESFNETLPCSHLALNTVQIYMT